MGVKLWPIDNSEKYPGQEEYIFHCPGCDIGHKFVVKWNEQKKQEHIDWCKQRGFTYNATPIWTFNGSMELPTFSPSLLMCPDEPSRRCHSFVRDGKIQFLDDCFHKLKGQTVEIPDVDD